MWAGAAAISNTALVFVVWGISPVDYLTIWGMGLAPSNLKMSKEKSMKYVKSCLIITMLRGVGYKTI